MCGIKSRSESSFSALTHRKLSDGLDFVTIWRECIFISMGYRHAFIVCLCEEMSGTFFTVPDVQHINNENNNFALCLVKLIENII